MAFDRHNIGLAQWASYYRIPSTDTQYPPITARVTDTPEFDGAAVTYDEVYSRFAVGVEHFRGFSNKSTVTNSSITTGTEVLVENLDRKGFKIWNNGAASIYIVEGDGTASAANQTLTLAGGELYTSSTPVWTGRVHIVSAGTSSVTVTEYV